MTERDGFWGGTSARERRTLRVERTRRQGYNRLPPVVGLVEYLADEAAEA
jgi:hypothetical protein